MLLPGSVKRSVMRPQFSVAYTIVAINIFVFVFSNLFFGAWPSAQSSEQMQDNNLDVAMAQMYTQTLDTVERKELKQATTDQLASLALRDYRFWTRVNTFPFTGDQVQITKIKNLITNVKEDYSQSAQFRYGLSPMQTSPWAWITYQFTHYSFAHLFGNLLFVFLLIAYLEKTIDAMTIVTVYILGGIGGGVAFLIFNTDGNLSVIGASGSLCALMAFMVVVKKNENMPWTYFFAPVPKGYGEIYLPVFLIFPIYLVADFTSMLWSPGGVSSSIAHSAHVGGTITGLVMGLGFLAIRFFRRKAASHGVLGDDDGFNKLF